jgi:hypothetical protein
VVVGLVLKFKSFITSHSTCRALVKMVNGYILHIQSYIEKVHFVVRL